MRINRETYQYVCIFLLGLFGTTGCVTSGEYQRMKAALGQEIIELRQLRKDNGKELQKLRAKFKNDFVVMQKKLSTTKKNYDNLKMQCSKEKATLNSKLKVLLSEQKRKAGEIDRCGKMLKGRGKKLFDLQDELSKKQAEFEKKQAEFEKKSSLLNEALAKKEKELKDKQDLLKTSIARAERLEKQVKKLRKIFDELNEKLKALVSAGKLKIQMVKGQLELQLPEKILFASGSSTVKSAGKKAITSVASILQTMNHRWQVVGHTDSVGNARMNWRLSARRATSVLFVMIKAGMPPAQMSLAGHGQYQPKAPNDTAENKSLNRRTEIVLVPDLSEIFASVKKKE